MIMIVIIVIVGVIIIIIIITTATTIMLIRGRLRIRAPAGERGGPALESAPAAPAGNCAETASLAQSESGPPSAGPPGGRLRLPGLCLSLPHDSAAAPGLIINIRRNFQNLVLVLATLAGQAGIICTDTHTGTDPDTAAGTDPGTAAGTDPGTGAGTDPGTGTGTYLGTGTGTEPVTDSGLVTGMYLGTGTETGTDPGTDIDFGIYTDAVIMVRILVLTLILILVVALALILICGTDTHFGINVC